MRCRERGAENEGAENEGAENEGLVSEAVEKKESRGPGPALLVHYGEGSHMATRVLAQSFVCCSANRVKASGVVDRHLGQHLAVQLDVGPLQSIDELTVAEAAHPTGGIDADNPQAAEVAFSHATIAERINACSQESLFDSAEQIVASAAIALRAFVESLLRPITSGTFGGSHQILLGNVPGRLRMRRPLFARKLLGIQKARAKTLTVFWRGIGSSRGWIESRLDRVALNLVAVVTQSFLDLLFHALGDTSRATQIAFSLL